jgi:hypothetical protein
MTAELRQRLNAALVMELTGLSGNRPPHNLSRNAQSPRYPSDALAFHKVRAADSSYRLHGHHSRLAPSATRGGIRRGLSRSIVGRRSQAQPGNYSTPIHMPPCCTEHGPPATLPGTAWPVEWA